MSILSRKLKDGRTQSQENSYRGNTIDHTVVSYWWRPVQACSRSQMRENKIQKGYNTRHDCALFPPATLKYHLSCTSPQLWYYMKYKTSFPERLSVWFLWARHTDWDLKSPIKPTFEFHCIFPQQVTLKAEASSLLTQYAGKTLKLCPVCQNASINMKAGSERSYMWSWELKGQKMIDSGYTQLEETKILWRRECSAFGSFNMYSI